MNADQGFVIAFITPFAFAILAAVYSYFDFASNAITSPNIWIATFLAALFTYAIVYFITIGCYIWRYCS